MPKNKNDVIAGLKKKGFEDSPKNTHHIYYVYRTTQGKISKIYTYTSHSGKEITDPILSAMAKQCRLKKADFLKLIDCTMSRQEYENEMKNQSQLG